MDVAAYRNADALVHVVRAFRDESVPHVSGSVDPARDAQAMEDELILADLGVAERRLERLDKDLKKSRTADLERERDVMVRCKDALEAGTPLRALDLAGDDLKRLRGFQFLSAKPLLVVINLDEADVATVGGDVGACGRSHGARAPSSPAPRHGPYRSAQDRARDRGARPGRRRFVPRPISACRSPDWIASSAPPTICSGTCRSSPWEKTSAVPGRSRAEPSRSSAAGEIHSDIARGFIRAEVVAYEPLVTRGSMAACREHGEVRLEGKEYVVADGDVINFRFAT